MEDNDKNRKILAEHLALTEDDLLAQIGQDLSPGQMAFPQPPEWYQKKAIDWIRQREQDFRRLICSNNEIKKQALDPSDDLILGLAIATLIADVCLKLNVSALTVSALLVKRGLMKLCSDQWGGSD